MKFIAYIRVSTDDQKLSVEAQRNACAAYAAKQGAVIAQEVIDEDTCGATPLNKRVALLDAINGMGKGDLLVIAKRDRMGRDPIENAMIERAVERKGGRIISASGDVTDGTDPASILMKRMVDAFSEYERLIIGARTSTALQTKKSKGQRVGHIPFGQKLAEDRIHLEACEVEQDILKQISDLKSRGLSVRAIAKEMNERKAFNRGSEWNNSSIHRMLARAA